MTSAAPASGEASGIPPRARPRSLSGMQPTSDSLHIGNYVGALVNWVQLQETYEAFYFVADLHSLTVPTAPELIRHRSRVTAAQFVAAGVDPHRSAVFCQSHLPQHPQLGWIMNCLASTGEASRMTQFKDKVARGQNANVGLFTYPMLMAADILLYDADKVPVGEDQRQHLEITRDLATRFNQRYGPTLVVPEPHILRQTARIMELGDPTAKMSGTTSPEASLVLLSDDPKRITKKIKAAVTDTEREVRYDPQHKPGVSNLLAIESALTGVPVTTLEKGYAAAGYGQLKASVAERVIEAVRPFQERMAQLLGDPPELDRILASGAERAAAVATATVERVFDRVGLLPPLRSTAG